jgi:hypothetical protein
MIPTESKLQGMMREVFALEEELHVHLLNLHIFIFIVFLWLFFWFVVQKAIVVISHLLHCVLLIFLFNSFMATILRFKIKFHLQWLMFLFFSSGYYRCI